jgi:DNA invertase Pin-like site-specific DNA recombinase
VYADIRVSTKSQADGYSLEQQESSGKAFAASLGQPFKLCKDVESGAKATRKCWQSLLSDLQKATDKDTIWFGSQGRLSRDAETFQHF